MDIDIDIEGMYTDIVFHTISGNQQVAMMNVPFIIFFVFS